MKRWFNAALLLLATFVAGCASSQEDAGRSHKTLGKLPAASGLSYQLQRIEPFLTEPLEDRYWKLIELRGEAVEVEEDQREAHLVLHSEGQRVSGATGCNRLMGSFERGEESLKLGEMGTTMMACSGDSMTLERRFLEALGDVASYRVLVNRLELYDDRGELLARFEVRHLT